MARLEKLISNSNLLQDTKTTLLKAENSLKDHLTQDDLVGALRDKFGKEVRRSGDGKTYQHLEEVQEGINSLENSKNRLIGELRKTAKGSPEFVRLSQELDGIKEVSRKVNSFLDIK